MKNLKEVNPKRWIDLTHFHGTGSKRHKLTWKSLFDLEFSQMDLFQGTFMDTEEDFACVDVEPGSGLVWTSFKKKTSIQRQHLLSCPEINLRTCLDAHVCLLIRRSPSTFPLSASYIFYSFTLPLLSTLPSWRRCGKHRVLSFPQYSAGCHCRRWTPSRQLCLWWALWFTVWGHAPQTGNLWILPLWQSSAQVSF